MRRDNPGLRDCNAFGVKPAGRLQNLAEEFKAGVVPWPKLLHNLRASRQTELAERYPIHLVCAWLGNSAAIAKEHYLQVTEAHYEQAAQKAAQSADKQGGQRVTSVPTGNQDVQSIPTQASVVNFGPISGLPLVGLEPTTR